MRVLRRLPAAAMLATIGLVLCPAALAAQAPQRAVQLPVLPLTEVDEHASAADLDRTVTLMFPQPVGVREFLATLVRDTTLGIVADPSISGSFVGDLKNVTIRQALGDVLPPMGVDYLVDGSVIRVSPREMETRLIDIDAIAVDRRATTTTGGGSEADGAARIVTTAGADWAEDLAKGVRPLLSERGTFSIDRKAGLLQATDFGERLDRVQTYVDAVSDRVTRQVEIDARILEVELDDPGAQSLDLAALATGAATSGGVAGGHRSLSVLGSGDLARFMSALEGVGKVSVIGDPRIVTLNNEPALVRAVTRGGTILGEEGVTLPVTPRIGADGSIMLSLSPGVSRQVAEPSGKTPALTSVRATDTLARIADGGTLILGGFARTRETHERQTGGRSGWFGRSTVVTRKTIELVILLTPHTVGSREAP